MLKAGFFAAAVAIILLLLKPAFLTTDDRTRLLFLLRWQPGTISFTNSVTQRPVTIRFRVEGRFEDFSILTDKDTEGYYSHGLYDLNEAASSQSTSTLRICSMTGICLTIGFYSIFIRDGCAEVSLLWRI